LYDHYELKSETTLKDVVMACLKILFQDLREGTEEDHRTSPSGQPFFWPRFKPETAQIRGNSDNTLLIVAFGMQKL